MELSHFKANFLDRHIIYDHSKSKEDWQVCLFFFPETNGCYTLGLTLHHLLATAVMLYRQQVAIPYKDDKRGIWVSTDLYFI